MKKIKIDLSKVPYRDTVFLHVNNLMDLVKNAIEKKAEQLDFMGMKIRDLYTIMEALQFERKIHLSGYSLVKNDFIRKFPDNHPIKKNECVFCGKSYLHIYDHKWLKHRIPILNGVGQIKIKVNKQKP